MSDTVEIDLEAEKARVDGEWLSRDELWERMNQSIATKDYKNISRLAGLLEQVDEALAGAQSITLKLSAEHFAKLEAAGTKLGKSAAVFAREVLVQVLGGTAPRTEPAPVPLSAPPPVIAPPPVAAGAAPLSIETPEEEPPALTLQPKRREGSPLASPASSSAPPVMTPVASPNIQGPDTVSATDSTVVVEVGEEDKPAARTRSWFDRT